MLSELLSKINISNETYGLSSEFAEVTSAKLSNGLIQVKLLQRDSRLYDDVMFIGFQKPQIKTQGIIVFVAKQKYPVFIPLNQNIGQKKETVQIVAGKDFSASTEVGSAEINTSDPNTWVQFDRTFAYLNYSSTAIQQWGTQYLEDRVKQIAEDWLFDTQFNPNQIKLYLGAIGYKGGRKFHQSHHSGNEADIYVNAEASSIENTYNINQIKRLLTIFKNNGVRYIFFNPSNYNSYSEFQSWVSNRAKGHENHFHLRF